MYLHLLASVNAVINDYHKKEKDVDLVSVKEKWLVGLSWFIQV